MTSQFSIANWHRPLFSISCNASQTDLHRASSVGKEGHFRFGVFADFAIEIFDKIGRVDNRADLDWEIKKGSQVISVAVPTQHGMAILLVPLMLEVRQCRCSLFSVYDTVQNFV